ncbi:hypothetical protein LM701481_40143 [Listeria monocytogenes]|nr:hypothetical protein LM701481_40143 [Listeria monocytogenes]
MTHIVHIIILLDKKGEGDVYDGIRNFIVSSRYWCVDFWTCEL